MGGAARDRVISSAGDYLFGRIFQMPRFYGAIQKPRRPEGFIIPLLSSDEYEIGK
jgi:hypothetical protein